MGDKKLLVGCTGFVGSNLAGQAVFDGAYHSTDIGEAYGAKPDLLVYAGVPAEKYLANNFPQKDLETVKAAFQNIERINPKRVVLISTIDVYKDPRGVDEGTPIDTEGLHAYGLHRRYLEQWVAGRFPDHLVVRLPGLYGKNIKKNFIYDMINLVPAMLAEPAFQQLSAGWGELGDYYQKQPNGFYRLAAWATLPPGERRRLRAGFERAGFTALQFTDSRAQFQFYNLDFLWGHIQKALSLGLRLLNLATGPVGAAQLYEAVRGGPFVNELEKPVPHYDFRSQYAAAFGGAGGYLQDAAFVLADIGRFVAWADKALAGEGEGCC